MAASWRNGWATACTAIVLVCLAVAGAAMAGRDLEGWRGARWGMSAAELRQTLGDSLIELERPRQYGGARAPLMMPAAEFLGVPFDVYFQISTGTGGLQQVLLETGHGRAGPRGFAGLFWRLREHYGNESKLCLERGGAGVPASAEAFWRFETTTVHAVFMDFYSRGLAFEDPNVDPDPLVPYFRARRNNPRFLPRRILIRYHPSGRADLFRESCRPD